MNEYVDRLCGMPNGSSDAENDDPGAGDLLSQSGPDSFKEAQSHFAADVVCNLQP
ncbi:hypothetical protein Acid7E03_40970 [Acidisoma sp. 7E03]